MKTYGIDANALLRSEGTGVEKYVRFLLTEMMKLPLEEGEKVLLYAARPKPASLELPKGWEWRCLSFFLPKGWTHIRLSIELLFHSPDVFFSPAHEIPFLRGRAAVVSTVHDVAFRHDARLYGGKASARQEWAIARVKKYAKRVLAVSEATRRDLGELFAFDLSRVIVTPLAPSFSQKPTEEETGEVLRKYRLTRGQYISYVGRIEEKKNVATLIKALLLLKSKLGNGHPLELVLAGSLGYRGEEIRAIAENSSFASQIRFLGYIPDADVPPLLSGSLAFVFPSSGEGFGLPVLEAMVSETPVIASDIPAVREVAGDAAKLIPPTHVDGFAEALRTFVFEERAREDYIEKGKERVRHFSWETTARKTFEVLRSL
jgi:glycosyltransferase involved in cell wall biosynthesis